MSRVIVVTSGKGGVGKTTTSVNLATAINNFGEDVVVVDANFTTPDIGLHLGAPIVPVTLNHVLSGKAKIAEAIYEHESGTKVVPGTLSIKDLDKIDHEKIVDVAKKLKKAYNYVILDCGAGLGPDAISAIEAADDVIIVTNPEMPSVTNALKTIKFAEQLGKEVKGAIINRVRNNKSEMSLAAIKSMLETKIIGIVPEDPKVQEALSLKNPISLTHPKSKVARAYKRIAANILGLDIAEIKEYREGFFRRILGI